MKKILDYIKNWFSFVLGNGHQTIEIVETPTEPAPEKENNNGETEQNNSEINNSEMEHKIIVLIDNGHASSTPGKRSPKEDGKKQFFEYEFNRDIAKRLAEKLDELKIKYEILVPEVDVDVPLSERAARANAFCKEYGTDNCLFISIHSNAAGNGTQWMNARGWCCYTSKGETASDSYAEIFMRKAIDILTPLNQKVRKYSAKKYSWEENYTVLVKTICPAILTENMFYDNKQDLEFLETEEGKEAIVQIHIDSILEIEKSLGN